MGKQGRMQGTETMALVNSPIGSSETAQYRADQSGRTVAAEYGGPQGVEPTRYGDWEKNGRCIDF